ncbi:uncharacterized protein LOC143710318 [Siphateles boraxobius]|uniref:uncharacterized protein LOC143710318 n=1 Tax=Siphateles boraxobius TaxID=180520 RepID=UPI004063B8C3
MTVVFSSISVDPCSNYESLDRPWRATNESGLWICDDSFSWSGWYRFFYNGMDIRMSESCVSGGSCNTDISLSLSGSHPQIEDGVVIRKICGASFLNGCCDYRFSPIRIKACPGDFYVYELVKPYHGCSAYCTDISTISQTASTASPAMITESSLTTDYGPCNNYNILDNYWRNTLNNWHMYGYISGYDDTRIEWHGWYRLFINGSSAQMPEWCFSYMSCGGFSSLWLGGSHPQLEDGVVTRDVYGSVNDQYNSYRSDPIQVKACPGNYYVYKFTMPNPSIPVPVYCAVTFNTPNTDPCDNYTSLDDPWRATDNSSFSNMCDYNVNWNGWYRLFYNGQSVQMPESCVGYGMCGSENPLWLNGSHPQLEDGVVTRKVCGSTGNDCCGYRSHPIQVKACPGNYYVYEFVRPILCASYCADVTSLNIPSASTTTQQIISIIFFLTVFFPLTALIFDPCYNYTILDNPWRATDNRYTFNLMCDTNVNWVGWYRLFIQGQSVHMPDTCVDRLSCGTHSPLWINDTHPRVEDGVVTRGVCGHWSNDCCYFQSNPIKVKACPGNYYVYEFVAPIFCYMAYCADRRNRCSELNCTEDERCENKHGVYGCFCKENHHRSHRGSFDFSETCESSSGSMSLSRCQLFEAGFPSDNLHLNDPNCRGTVRNGRVEFYFDNNDHICGTNLVANGTHFIYENFIVAEPHTVGHLISRKRILKLSFSCVYLQTQTLSMDINPLESIVHRILPAGQGTYRVRMITYQDAEFTHPFTGSVNVELDRRIFVEVRVDGVDSRQFASVIDECWATPVNDPHYSLRWDLIVDKCPNPEDNTVNLLQSGVSTSSRFSFEMFIFTANSTKVYLHCAIHLCLQTDNHCPVHCDSEHHHREGRSVDFHDSASISMGPLIWSDSNKDTQMPRQVQVSKAPWLCGSLTISLISLMSVLIFF